MRCSVHSVKYSVKMSIIRCKNSITSNGGTRKLNVKDTMHIDYKIYLPSCSTTDTKYRLFRKMLIRKWCGVAITGGMSAGEVAWSSIQITQTYKTATFYYYFCLSFKEVIAYRSANNLLPVPLHKNISTLYKKYACSKQMHRGTFAYSMDKVTQFYKNYWKYVVD